MLVGLLLYGVSDALLCVKWALCTAVWASAWRLKPFLQAVITIGVPTAHFDPILEVLQANRTHICLNIPDLPQFILPDGRCLATIATAPTRHRFPLRSIRIRYVRRIYTVLIGRVTVFIAIHVLAGVWGQVMHHWRLLNLLAIVYDLGSTGRVQFPAQVLHELVPKCFLASHFLNIMSKWLPIIRCSARHPILII